MSACKRLPKTSCFPSAGRLLRAPGLVIEPYSGRKRQRDGSQDSQPEFPPAPPAPPANSSCWDF